MCLEGVNGKRRQEVLALNKCISNQTLRHFGNMEYDVGFRRKCKITLQAVVYMALNQLL